MGLHAKPGDPSILIFKGAPYPRPIICRGPRPAGVAGISILGFQILKESRQAKRLGTEMIEDSVRFDLLIIFRKEDYR